MSEDDKFIKEIESLTEAILSGRFDARGNAKAFSEKNRSLLKI